MRIALTLVTRNDADVLDAHLAYDLSAGIDVVIATDLGSTDGTGELPTHTSATDACGSSTVPTPTQRCAGPWPSTAPTG